MTLVLRIGLGALAVLVVALVGFGGWAKMRASDSLAHAQERVDADWATWGARVKADGDAWKDDDLFAQRDGGDASGVLFAHVRWERVDAGPELGATLTEQIKSWSSAWPTHAGDAGVEQLDLTWMSQLEGAAYWDLEPDGGQLDGMPFDALNEPIPRFDDLTTLAKARLLQGLATNTGPAAARDVRTLARLCLTTEHLVGEMVGVALLGIERHAWEEAIGRGLDVTEWKPVNEADQGRLKRALWAAQAPYLLVAHGDLAAYRPVVGQCGGLREGVGQAHFLRGYLERAMPERYEALQRELVASPCRLRRPRAAWLARTAAGTLAVSGQALCPIESDSPLCQADWLVKLPFARDFVGLTLANIAMGDWFKPYRTP
ncbi:MAG: hypothetical protein U0228_29505 [Myxococcaceae bacterium]